MKENDTTLTDLSLIKILGVFDLDPCAYRGRETATNLICLPQDGLSSKWFGRVWLNPPYSCPSLWMEKMQSHNNGIALVLNSTDTKWFQTYTQGCSGFFFFKGRPTFYRKNKTEVKLMRSSVLVIYGDNNLKIVQKAVNEGQLSGFIAIPT